jgi:hypothetical protein
MKNQVLDMSLFLFFPAFLVFKQRKRKNFLVFSLLLGFLLLERNKKYSFICVDQFHFSFVVVHLSLKRKKDLILNISLFFSFKLKKIVEFQEHLGFLRLHQVLSFHFERKKL